MRRPPPHRRRRLRGSAACTTTRERGEERRAARQRERRGKNLLSAGVLKKIDENEKWHVPRVKDRGSNAPRAACAFGSTRAHSPSASWSRLSCSVSRSMMEMIAQHRALHEGGSAASGSKEESSADALLVAQTRARDIPCDHVRDPLPTERYRQSPRRMSGIMPRRCWRC